MVVKVVKGVAPQGATTTEDKCPLQFRPEDIHVEFTIPFLAVTTLMRVNVINEEDQSLVEEVVVETEVTRGQPCPPIRVF